MINGHDKATQEITHSCVRVNEQVLVDSWPWLREKVCLIKNKLELAHARRGYKHPHSYWIPENVRSEVIKGLQGKNTAELYYIVNEKGKADGFFITSVQFDPWNGLPLVLFVWLIWIDPKMPWLFEQNLPFVENLARMRGCVRVRGMSPRSGWISRVFGSKFRVMEYVFEKEVG